MDWDTVTVPKNTADFKVWLGFAVFEGHRMSVFGDNAADALEMRDVADHMLSKRRSMQEIADPWMALRRDAFMELRALALEVLEIIEREGNELHSQADHERALMLILVDLQTRCRVADRLLQDSPMHYLERMMKCCTRDREGLRRLMRIYVELTEPKGDAARA